jgi:uncharacterized protein YukE
MISFNKFSEYVGLMSQISDNLKDFASRTTNIDSVVQQIDSSLQENKRLSQFLASHFEKIELAGLASLKAVDISDSHFKEAIEKLKEETENTLNLAFRAVNDSASHFSEALEKLKEEVDNRISRLNQDATDNESRITGIYNEIAAKLTAVTSQHIGQLQAAYSNALPQFDQLNNLRILPKIQEQVSDSFSRLQSDSDANTLKLVEAVNQLNITMEGVKENLTSLAATARSRTARPKKPKTGILRRLRNPFSFFLRKRNPDQS